MKLDKLFGTHKVNAIDIFDDDEADLSATKEISLAESSLVEMLNIYESKKNERSIENEFQVHIPESEKTFKKPLPKKEIKPKKTIELKKKAPSPKSTVHKPMDWSHVKGSGYGPSATSKRESRPKISPRLHQKVENVKRERIAQINKRQQEAEKENVPIIPQKIETNLNRTIDQSLHETLVDTLKTEIDHERSIRLQLEKQYEAEITRHQEKEIEHRKEIVRILSTHEAPKVVTAGGPDGDSLLEGYKGENERLYAKAKELELEVKRLQSLGNFSNNDAIVRLEDLLKNEENMRREIEKTARNLKMELQEVQKSNALKEAEMALINQKLTAAEMSATRINKELELKLKIENELKKQVEHWKTISSQASYREDEFKSTLEQNHNTKIRNIEIQKNKEIKRLEKELQNARKRAVYEPMNPPRPNSSSSGSQTDHHFNTHSQFANISPKKIHKLEKEMSDLKMRLDSTQTERNSFHKQLLEKEQTTLNIQIESERKQLKITQLEQELQKLLRTSTEYESVKSELEKMNILKQEKESLESYLRDALDDREVFEQRSSEAEELLQVAQVEIDKRHNLIMKLHANSNQMIDEYKNIELQKKCLEVENQNLQYEIEQVRQASVPENVARISAKLSVMERERQKRENDLRMTLMSRDPKAQHMIADQTHQITKLKTELNAKTNLYAKSQIQLKEMQQTLSQLKEQIRSSQFLIQ